MPSGGTGAWHDRVRALATMLEAVGYTVRFTRDVRHLFGEPPAGSRRPRVHVELEASVEDLDRAIKEVSRALEADS